MIRERDKECPICGGNLRPYGSASRIVKTKYGRKYNIHIKRYKCTCCKIIHNKLPDYIIPYIRYEADIFLGVIEGLITSDTLGFEEYPCETTMKRWSQKIQLPL